MLTARVSEQEVMSVPEPEWTKSWHPVSHGKVIEAMELAVKDTGMDIVSRSYSLAGKGTNVFGTWLLDKEDNGMKWMVGFRNSMSKSLALGVCAGNHIINCSNMQFRGDDFIEFRKHTGGLDWDELVEIAKKAMVGLIERMGRLATWHSSLKERRIDQDDFKVLTFDAMKGNIFFPQQFPKFLDCYDMEQKTSPETGDTMYQFNGGVTRLLRDQSLFAISHRTTNLIKMLGDFIEDHPQLRRRTLA